MSTTTVPGVPADITLLVGPLLLGYLFNWCLFGVLCLQTYIYYLSFPDDSRHVKCLVYFLFFVDTLQTALTTHNAWHFLSAGWGDLAVLSDPGWSWIAVPLFSGIVSGTVQLFFAWRIWRLSGSRILSGLIVCLALAQSISAMVSGIWFAILNDITKISTLFPSATVWLGGSALTDVIITVSLVAYLSRSSTGFSTTNDIITRLIRMTVQTGAVTSLAAIVELILFLVYKTNNLHMIPALALAKLYTNTLVATLNSRSQAFTSSRGATTSRTTDNPHVSTHQARKLSRSQVQVTTVRETTEDVAMVNLTVPSRQVPVDKSNDETLYEDDEMKSYVGFTDSKRRRSSAEDLESGR
ncbi:hypothetical protein FRC03_011811 [Tulasnella sp. 419]|nr:hypothetical protein FRC02_008092 [Tulasnella sp. 418]KAG8970012.1 hypothetical protein FRC03_011811 [Tulasnella sp. 419]